jgi:hypothetical protein
LTRRPANAIAIHRVDNATRYRRVPPAAKSGFPWTLPKQPADAHSIHKQPVHEDVVQQLRTLPSTACAAAEALVKQLSAQEASASVTTTSFDPQSSTQVAIVEQAESAAHACATEQQLALVHDAQVSVATLKPHAVVPLDAPPLLEALPPPDRLQEYPRTPFPVQT